MYFQRDEDTPPNNQRSACRVAKATGWAFRGGLRPTCESGVRRNESKAIREQARGVLWSTAISGRMDDRVAQKLTGECLRLVPDEATAGKTCAISMYDAGLVCMIYSLEYLRSGVLQEAVWCADRAVEAAELWDVEQNPRQYDQMPTSFPLVKGPFAIAEVGFQERVAIELGRPTVDGEAVRERARAEEHRFRQE